jgi:BioD-like phosphotransacetylase family protein
VKASETSLLIGLSQALGKRFGYLKPFGDRPLYRKKRLWDQDAAVFVSLLGIEEDAETASIGFDHSKLRYTYDRASTFAALRERLAAAGRDRDAVLIEGGKDLSCGASIFLDPLTISRELDAPVVIVAGGSDDAIADDLAYVERFIGRDEARVSGAIINKVTHPDDFRDTLLPEIEALGIEVLGVIPHEEDLATRSVSTIADRLFARVLAGESGLGRVIRTVTVGAMSADAAMSASLIHMPEKLVITSGDRSDMILAAIDAGGTSAILLTNNILPPPNVISRAEEAEVPVLLVPGDTYAVALQVERIDPLLTEKDADKIARLRDLCLKYVDLERVARLL